MRRRPLRALLLFPIAAGIAFGGWYFGSPVWTVYQIREAVQARDVRRLSAYVDYPALRESLRAELRPRLEGRLAALPAGPLAALRDRAGRALLDRTVDLAVTPTVLWAMLGAAGAAAERRPPVRIEPANAELVRESFDRFTLRANGGALIFERRGLGWQIAGVRLPPEAGPSAGRTPGAP